MRISKGAVETRAFIVGLGQRKEEFARAGRPGINRKINYFFVKELSAETGRRSAHQTCCRLNVHVILSEPPAVAGGPSTSAYYSTNECVPARYRRRFRTNSLVQNPRGRPCAHQLLRPAQEFAAGPGLRP